MLLVVRICFLFENILKEWLVNWLIGLNGGIIESNGASY